VNLVKWKKWKFDLISYEDLFLKCIQNVILLFHFLYFTWFTSCFQSITCYFIQLFHSILLSNTFSSNKRELSSFHFIYLSSSLYKKQNSSINLRSLFNKQLDTKTTTTFYSFNITSTYDMKDYERLIENVIFTIIMIDWLYSNIHSNFCLFINIFRSMMASDPNNLPKYHVYLNSGKRENKNKITFWSI
jgi:hypothetical protein